MVGNERTPHRGWYLSTYERTKTEGERAALAASREVGQDLVLVNPSSVQGPGRAGGTGRILLAFLDGRLRVFVPTCISLVDIDDCVAGHLLAAERGVAGERYLLNGMTLEITDALALAANVAGVQRKPRLLPRRVATAAAAVIERGCRTRAAPAAGVPRDGQDAASRTPVRRIPRRTRPRPALHRPARDDPQDRRLGARRGPHSLTPAPRLPVEVAKPPREPPHRPHKHALNADMAAEGVGSEVCHVLQGDGPRTESGTAPVAGRAAYGRIPHARRPWGRSAGRPCPAGRTRTAGGARMSGRPAPWMPRVSAAQHRAKLTKAPPAHRPWSYKRLTGAYVAGTDGRGRVWRILHPSQGR